MVNFAGCPVTRLAAFFRSLYYLSVFSRGCPVPRAMERIALWNALRCGTFLRLPLCPVYHDYCLQTFPLAGKSLEIACGASAQRL